MIRFPVLGLLACAAASDAAPTAWRSPTAADAALLRGELRCAFVAGRSTLLLASADVGRAARPDAVVRRGAAAVRLVGTATGGFAALERGGTFRAGATEARVSVGRQRRTGTEERRFGAALSLRSGPARRRHRGEWRCGP